MHARLQQCIVLSAQNKITYTTITPAFSFLASCCDSQVSAPGSPLLARAVAAADHLSARIRAIEGFSLMGSDWRPGTPGREQSRGEPPPTAAGSVGWVAEDPTRLTVGVWGLGISGATAPPLEHACLSSRLHSRAALADLCRWHDAVCRLRGVGHPEATGRIRRAVHPALGGARRHWGAVAGGAGSTPQDWYQNRFLCRSLLACGNERDVSRRTARCTCAPQRARRTPREPPGASTP